MQARGRKTRWPTPTEATPAGRGDWLPLPWTDPLTEQEAAALARIRADLAGYRDRLRAIETSKRGAAIAGEPLVRWGARFNDLRRAFWIGVDEARKRLRGTLQGLPDDALRQLREWAYVHADVSQCFPRAFQGISPAAQVELFVLACVLWEQDQESSALRSLQRHLALLLECDGELSRRADERGRADPVAEKYTDEFYGYRLLRIKHGTATPRERNELLKAAWPRTKDGKHQYRVGTPKGHGFLAWQTRHETREWMETVLIPRFIAELERKYGSLEAAVAAGKARGLRQWVRWRFVDEHRRRQRVRGELALEREGGLDDGISWGDLEVSLRRDDADSDLDAKERALWPGIDVWQRVEEAGLPEEDRLVLVLYEEGYSHVAIGATLGVHEATIRKRLKRIHQRLGLPPRPLWKRRPLPTS